MPARDWWRKLSPKLPEPSGRPPNRGPGSQPPIRRTGLGLLLIAIGRREGLEDFGNTPDAYLASLAPLIAFAFVSCAYAGAAGHVEQAIQLFLILLCAWLAPPVISHPIARVWGHAEYWPRYANVLNWAPMLMFVVLSAASAVAKAAIIAGLPQNSVLAAGAGGVLVYAIWFHWFVARGTLGLSRGRTLLLLLAVAIGTNIIIAVPLLATGAHLPGLMKDGGSGGNGTFPPVFP